jgi:predicted deacylase
MMPPVEEFIMKEHINSIKSYHFGAEESGPHLLLTAGVHGDEYEPVLAALQLMSEMPGLLTRGSVTIVPIVNVTAFEHGIRYGTDGLDLARICPGDSIGSPSERNAFQISELIKKANYLIDMHTGGLAHDIYAMAGFMLHPDSDVLKKQREMALAYNFPVIWGTDPFPNGRTLSVARDLAIPSIYLEYGGGSCIRNHVVASYRDGFINVLKLLNMADGPCELKSVEERYWVEDSRPDSGYFQGKMPSPTGGIFVAAVSPGVQVKKGEQFGRIIDPTSGTSEDIKADIDGLVLSVRVNVRVAKGDALGSILPILSPGKVII